VYAKYRIEKLIKAYAPAMIEELGLCAWKITWHIVGQRTKYVKNSDAHDTRNLNAVVVYKSNIADVYLFYNNIRNRKDAIATMFHEMLHLSVVKLLQPRISKLERAKLEEELVLRLEALYTKRLS